MGPLPQGDVGNTFYILEDGTAKAVKDGATVMQSAACFWTLPGISKIPAKCGTPPEESSRHARGRR